METQMNAVLAADQARKVMIQDGEEDTIDLVELFYLFLEHIWKILLCVVLGGFLAFLYTFFLVTPMYKSTSKIYIVSASNDSLVSLADLQIGSQLTADYQALMTVRPLLEDVIKNLDLEYTPAELVENVVTINNPSDTRILEITAVSDDPEEAAAIANELAQQAIIYLPRIMECDTPNIAETAVIPEKAYTPSYVRNILVGAFLVAAAYCGVLVVLFLMDDSLSTMEDIEKRYNVQVLAMIPESGKSGAKGYGYGYGYGYRNALQRQDRNSEKRKKVEQG